MSIANQITRLQEAKQSIKTAIKGKGVTVGDDVKLDGYAALIDNISIGSGDGEEHANPDFYNVRTNNGTDYGYLFYFYSGENLDVSNFDTSQVTNMAYTFGFCSYLTSLDVSNFNTSRVTDMNSMFYYCKLTTLDLSKFNTSKVTDMKYMFFQCQNLTTLDLSSFDTSQVTNMSNMFYRCQSLTTLDLSNWDTSKVTNMGSMFSYCNKLTSLDLSSFNTKKVTSYNNMLKDVPTTCTIYINPGLFINKNTGKTFTPAELGWTGTFTERIVINPITPPIDPTDPNKPHPPA